MTISLPHSRQQYGHILTKIKEISCDASIVKGGLISLISPIYVAGFLLDEQDNIFESFGLRKSKSNHNRIEAVYFFKKRGKPVVNLSNERATGYIINMAKRFGEITPEKIRYEFLKAVKDPIREYLMRDAGIEQKVTEYQNKICCRIF